MTGSEKGRKIKAHKGGRTDRLFARVTKLEKAEIFQKARKLGLSIADLIIAAIRKFEG
uniref:Uncharacterized protein n=1 Tax=viral metagenome TaxID=1070528 RepID=A0A6M3XNZ2_9ZZZZ